VDGTKSSSGVLALILLIQTDTTVGFCSKDHKILNDIKDRPREQKMIKTCSSFKQSADITRVPASFKNRVRRSTKSTFIINNRAFRVVKSGFYSKILKRFGWLYSTSANRSGSSYDELFAKESASVIVERGEMLYESSASAILKLNNNKIVKVRA